MNIALTYNSPRAGCESDTPETIARITGLLDQLGHAVTPIDVARPLEQLIAMLRGHELVFNLAEGERGRFREAFYPALYEHLGLRYTGSSASTLALCLDKALAKRVVAATGMAVPRGIVVTTRVVPDVRLPAIVKPNFEGSSLGITQASVVWTRAELAAMIDHTLAAFPAGVLVEEYIAGDDIAIGWVEGVGVLSPVLYLHDEAVFDRAQKQAHRIEVLDLCDELRPFTALGVTGFGRADFRRTPSGELVFLEMNPLPSLAFDNNELYAAAARLGKTPTDVIAALIAVH